MFFAITYDLVTHGASECYGVYNTGPQTGWGAAYENSCIHSDSNEYSGGNTVWYNYAITSAGTIIDKNTTPENPAANMNTATESVCPNNWSLPSKKQMDSNKNVSGFFPVLGGVYINGVPYAESSYGVWWSSEAYSGAVRYDLRYDTSSIYANDYRRSNGLYIRCVSEEKTVTDLTYMQDMTPQIAANTPEGTKATLTDRRDGVDF